MATTLRAILPHLVALLFGFGLMQMGNTLQGTLLSIRGDIEGFSPAQIGIIGASFWAGIVVGSLRSGMLIERVGHIRTFAAIASTIPLLDPPERSSFRTSPFNWTKAQLPREIILSRIVHTMSGSSLHRTFSEMELAPFDWTEVQ